jgi:N-terminal C2 in EEIG1 and EHBP1 proteins
MHSAKTATQSSRNLEDTLKSPTHLIGHLLPRHANFRARIQIHQISSVPFVSGEFGVRWKFKGVQSSSAQKKGLLGRVKAKAKINDKGKGRELDIDLLPSTPNYDVFPITPILAHPASAIPIELPSSRLPTDRSISLSSVETDNTSSLVPSSQSSLTASSQPTLHWADSSNPATANASHTTMVPESTLSELPDPLTVPIGSTLRRGTTPFLKLKDHSVVWSHTLDTLLKFDIDRETSQIHPNPLKLVVMQRVIPDDPDGSPQNPRLGAVYLNLAEYVGKGSVERKYLLKESKTNSVLKVSCCFSRLNPY